MSKWTPGPWEYGFSHWGRWQIGSKRADGTSFHIAELASYTGLGGREKELNEQQRANAILIAAAPEMAAENKRLRELNDELLGTLKTIARGLAPDNRNLDQMCRDMMLACDSARAAIAKTTGGE